MVGPRCLVRFTTALRGPIDDSNPEQGRIELATLGMLSLHAGHGVVLLLEVFHVFGELPVDVFGQHPNVGKQ